VINKTLIVYEREKNKEREKERERERERERGKECERKSVDKIDCEMNDEW